MSSRSPLALALLVPALALALAACDASTPAAPGAARPTVTLTEEAGAPELDPAAKSAAALSHADPALYDQPANLNSLYRCLGGPCQHAVDFTVPAGAHWTLTEIAIEGRRTPPPYAFDAFNFRLHADEGGQPAATPFFSRDAAAFTEGATDHPSYTAFGFDVSGPAAPVLAAGTYWLAFDMVNEDADFESAFGWRRRVPAAGAPALYGPIGDDWLVMSLGPDQDLAFHLYGYALTVDVKPGSAGNPVNLKEKGRLPVAVLTTPAFDAATLDLATITVGDGVGPETPVARRPNGTVMASLEDVDADGDLDLVLHVEVPALVAAGDLTAASTRLVVSGTTTAGGTPVRGADAVRLVSPSV